MASLRSLRPEVRPLAEEFVRALGTVFNVTVTSATRTLADQQRIYQRAQSGASRYPAAKPGSSPHQLGIAFDLHLSPKAGVRLPRGVDPYRLAGMVWEAVGLRWGGHFSATFGNDPIHFDFHPKGWVPGQPTPWGQPGSYGVRRRGRAG